MAGFRLKLFEPSNARERSGLLRLMIFALWAAIVCFTASRHILWRDEVEALVRALDASSFWTLPKSVDCGHPLLWYVLLKAAHDIWPSRLVLPVLAVLVAGCAVVVFLWRAPFSNWWKALFVFSGLPLFEYSVMARNYGISMLLLFLFAAAYTSVAPPAWLLGSILFLLANTNVHSAMLVPLLAVVWLWDFRESRRRSGLDTAGSVSVYAGIALALTGVLVAFLSVFPSKHDLIAQSLPGRSLLLSSLDSILLPGKLFAALLPDWAAGVFSRASIDALISVLLYLSVLGLVGRLPLFLAALVSLWVFSFFFSFFHPGAYRHEGLWLVFLVTLYWIRLRQELAKYPVTAVPGRWSRKALSAGLFGVLPSFLVFGIVIAGDQIHLDLEHPGSGVKSVVELLKASANLRDAIIIAEPDYLVQTVPYYANNKTYLIREGRYGTTVIFTRRARLDLRLSDVLATARRLRAETGRPIVILIGHPLVTGGWEPISSFSFGWTFRYSDEELRSFEAATDHLASFWSAHSDENFEVFALRRG